MLSNATQGLLVFVVKHYPDQDAEEVEDNCCIAICETYHSAPGLARGKDFSLNGTIRKAAMVKII